jgi:hypothetical protein
MENKDEQFGLSLTKTVMIMTKEDEKANEYERC